MAMPQVEGVVSRTPSPELLSSPGANGETEASLSQRRPYLLLPALHCRERGWASLPAPGGRVTAGGRVDSDPTPLAGGARFSERGGPGGPGDCLVPRVGLEAAQTLLQGPERFHLERQGLGDPFTGCGWVSGGDISVAVLHRPWPCRVLHPPWGSSGPPPTASCSCFSASVSTGVGERWRAAKDS